MKRKFLYDVSYMNVHIITIIEDLIILHIYNYNFTKILFFFNTYYIYLMNLE